ncbi:MAG: bis(5'-nucleosyl)-tetraphosphatase (symmetrical) YqeK [Clostridia bacterium]|nr:bis(5'-nucleosyl)-tetraphosphatase (symmetrical) YqeK [Clostridia bacterium]
MNKYQSLACSLALRMDADRLAHTVNVAQEASSLGKHFDLSEYDCERLYLAGLLHDITKALSTDEQIRLAQTLSIPLTEDDLASPPVLHAITGAALAAQEYPTLIDPEILSAIRAHTTGKRDMTLFEKLIYLADYIEKGRRHTVCVKRREAFYEDLATTRDRIGTLNRHLLAIANDTAQHIAQTNRPLHPMTQELIRSLQKELNQ